MTIKRIVSAFAIFAAVSFAGISLTAGTAAGAETGTCSSAIRTTGSANLDYHDLWSYTYEISWCVEGTKIVWVEPRITHLEFAETCTWVGSMEEWSRPEPGETAWTAFNMSEFACQSGDGIGTYAVNPWAIVTVNADGTHAVVDKGIAE